MIIKLVTFTDDRMTISAQKCAQSAMSHGADQYSIWTPNDLPEHFKSLQADVLRHERGAGFYCWKPFVVNEEVMKAADGDIIVWCDAGNEWIGDMREAVKGMDQDIMFFSNGWNHMDWCKMDCARAISPFDDLSQSDLSPKESRYKPGVGQVQASTFFIRVTPETRRFIKEWYAWSIMPGIIDNEPSVIPNTPTFQEHRWDQSILCCLQIKYQYHLHWFPTTTAAHLKSEFPNDKYPTLLLHHRKRNHEWA